MASNSDKNSPIESKTQLESFEDTTTDKTAEQRSTSDSILSTALPLMIAVIASTFAYIGSFAVEDNLTMMGFALLLFLLAALVFYLFRNKKQVAGWTITTLVGLSLPLIPLFSLIAGIQYIMNDNNTSNTELVTESVPKYVNRWYSFNWKPEEIDQLIIGTSTLDEIIALKGKASEATKKSEVYTLKYENPFTDDNVWLDFEKNEANDLILSHIFAGINDTTIKTESYSRKGWTKEEFENLSLSNSSTNQEGTDLRIVLNKDFYPYRVTHHFDDDSHSIQLLYANSQTNPNYVSGCILTFTTSDRGETFHLTEKIDSTSHKD